MAKTWLKIGLCGLLGVATVAPVFTAVAPAYGDEPQKVDITPQQKAMLRRAAQVAAYRALAEKIYGLQINADTTVGDWARQSDKVNSYIEQMVKGVRLEEPRYYSDGTAEVDAEVTLAQVVTTLKHAYDEVYHNGMWQKEQIDDITHRTVKTVISGVGYASVKDDRSNVSDEQHFAPPGHAKTGQDVEVKLAGKWVGTSGQQRVNARRVAELDAYRLMNERMTGLFLTAGSGTENSLLKNDIIKTATRGLVQGAKITEVQYLPDGLCQVTIQITIQQIVDHIESSLDQVDRNGFVQERHQLEDLEKHVERKVFIVNGIGPLDTSVPDNGNGGGSGIVIQ